MNLADADLAAVGRALGDPHRARFVLALLGGQDLTSGELAARAGVSPSLASTHLGKLLDTGLVVVVPEGRHRRYRLAGPDVARAIELLLTIAPQPPARGLTAVNAGAALRRARTCYDHLAGRLGIAVVDAFERDRLLEGVDSGWHVTPAGRDMLGGLGIDTGELARGRRPLLRPCQDWTERRPHLAGRLGAALADRFFELDWIRRSRSTRALVITREGENQLLARFAIRT